MRKMFWSALATAAIVVGVTTPVFAQATANGSVTVTVNVNARAHLTLGAAAITFADADPAVVPVMTAAPLTIDVGARTSAGGNVQLTMLATGDLVSGGNTILVNTLTWTAGGAGFVAGTTSAAAAQSVGAWTGSGQRSGTQTFSLPNSWAYAVGVYTTTLNYTLTVP